MTMKAPFLRRLVYERPEDKDGFPYDIELFTNGFDLSFTENITIICGENGSGKSTLLEVIATGCGFNTDGGSGSHVYKSREDLREFSDSFQFSWFPKTNRGFFFRAESFFNYASYIDGLAKEFGRKKVYRPYGGKSLHEQSHGESFLALFNNRISGKGVYIFDEPEAALSPTRQIAFLSILHRILSSGEAQIIMATHSPILMAYPKSQFIAIKNGATHPSTYQETEHYKVTRRFLENPDFYLRHIALD